MDPYNTGPCPTCGKTTMFGECFNANCGRTFASRRCADCSTEFQPATDGEILCPTCAKTEHEAVAAEFTGPNTNTAAHRYGVRLARERGMKRSA